VQLSTRVRDLAATVKLAIFDVDGVLTDGGLILGPNDQEFKKFHVRDGLGLVMLRESGVVLAIITGRESSVVTERMTQLGIEYVFQGQRDKLVAFESLLNTLKIEPAMVCYVGDDLPDLPVMMRVGLPVAVADAHSKLLEHAVWRTSANGGAGAVREVCELILASQGKLDGALARFESRGR
jgi:3-deoxy-D-manno-octulosonate 8-phosphate phosphatase (KDO 8-P phosphatase)